MLIKYNYKTIILCNFYLRKNYLLYIKLIIKIVFIINQNL